MLEAWSNVLKLIWISARLLLLLLLDPRLWPEGSYELWCLPFRPSVRKFSWDWLISFFWNSAWFFLKVSEAYTLCVTEPDFFFFLNFVPKNGENGPKIGFLGFIGKFSHLFWIWSMKKVHIICCILALTRYLGKIWFLRYGPKCSRPIRLQDF